MSSTEQSMQTSASAAASRPAAAPAEPLDLSEKGRRNGEAISLDRRLFMKFTAFTGCSSPEAAIERLVQNGVRGALYLDANDPQGIGIMAASEDPDFFVTSLRDAFNEPPFDEFEHQHAYDMLGRSYSIGYEPDLEDTLLVRPLRKLLDPKNVWAIWYPLQRSKDFQVLPAEQQRKILGEHGALAKRYGSAGVATDVRLACHGLDRDDNDFIVGLLGPQLFPLSSVVQAMRTTEQTAQYLSSLGPFFVGKAAWQSAK
ncbi:MAG TPA: chlorite dismutase family protein [Gammaproteobacteria bacterium]|nr:chlorite dismutase family protein [Gammaproteobacteria bacterium]